METSGVSLHALLHIQHDSYVHLRHLISHFFSHSRPVGSVEMDGKYRIIWLYEELLKAKELHAALHWHCSMGHKLHARTMAKLRTLPKKGFWRTSSHIWSCIINLIYGHSYGKHMYIYISLLLLLLLLLLIWIVFTSKVCPATKHSALQLPPKIFKGENVWEFGKLQDIASQCGPQASLARWDLLEARHIAAPMAHRHSLPSGWYSGWNSRLGLWLAATVGPMTIYDQLLASVVLWTKHLITTTRQILLSQRALQGWNAEIPHCAPASSVTNVSHWMFIPILLASTMCSPWLLL